MGSRVISTVLKLKDQNFSKGLRKANKDAGEFGRYVQVAQNKATNFANTVNKSFKNLAKGAIAGAAAGIAAVGVNVAKTALDMDTSFAKLQAQTGATASEMEKYKTAAKDAFSSGYGESLDEVANAVARIKQNMHGLGDGELASATKNAMLLAQTFESDVNEVTRGANNMIEAFGISSDKAFDLFTAGAQRGLNFSNEMFDNAAEYASLFGNMGYSAEEYFGILERGSKEGVYNLDYINDVMKEFQIRVKDGSKATGDAMKGMSKETQSVWQEFLNGNGTVSDVASTVVGELKNMDDQVEANNIGVSLFGTKWEDLESKAMYAMLGSTGAMKDFEGATESAAQAVEGSFGNRIKSVWRDLGVSIASLGDNATGKEFLDSLASTAEGLVPKITSLAESAMDFGNTIKDNWGPIKETVIGITTAVVAFKVGMMAMTIVSTVTGLIIGYRKAAAAGTVAQWAWNVALNANPIGLVVAGIAALIAAGVVLYRNWDTIKAKAIELWKKINENPFGSLLLKMNPITAVAQAISNNFGTIKTKFNEFKSAIQNFKMPAWVSTIGSTISSAAGKVKGLFDGSHATGLNTVPFDGYVAELHRGEMILPARQAQAVRENGGNINNVDKLLSGKPKTVVKQTTSKSSTKSVTVNMTVNANQLSYEQVVNRLAKDIDLALANM